jgi:hypothetical protein
LYDTVSPADDEDEEYVPIGDDGVQVALSSMIGIGHLGSSAVEEKEEKVDEPLGPA